MVKKFVLIVCPILSILFLSTLVSADAEIKLLFPKFQQDKSTQGKLVYSLAKEDDKQEYSEEGLKQFVEKFENRGYRVEQIELWVEGKAESGGITKFIVSAEAGGGIKIVLRLDDR
jgi:hypothetical protein